MRKNHRIQIYVTDELGEKIDSLAKARGISVSTLATLAIQAGLDAILIATNPDWQKLFETLEKSSEKKDSWMRKLAESGKSSVE